MATTKLWHIKGRLRDLIEYVENPAKTADPSMQDFFNVFSYTQNPDKTDGGEFVTAINCVKEIALEQMILTKKQFCKDDGYIPQYKYFTHIETLNPKWTPEFVRSHMGDKTYYALKRPVVSASPYLPEELRGTWQPGVLPKGTIYKPTSPFMKEELRKLDQYSREIEYMVRNEIETLDDLHADLSETEADLDRLRTIRTKLQNQIRRADPERKEALREEKAEITSQITELRKRRKMAINIEARSTHIDTMMTYLYENEMEAKTKTQTRTERSYSR